MGAEFREKNRLIKFLRQNPHLTCVFLVLQQHSFYRIFLQVKKIKRKRVFEKVPSPWSIILFLTGLLFIFPKKEFLFLQRNV